MCGCGLCSGCECWLLLRRIMGVFIGMVLCGYDYGLVCSCSWNVIVGVFAYLWVCFIYLHVCHVDSVEFLRKCIWKYKCGA